MKLYIEPRGGVAGDMLASALISAGADKGQMLAAMMRAAEKLGTAAIEADVGAGDAVRLNISIDHAHSAISGGRAYALLKETFEDLRMDEAYRAFGFRALQILVAAEIKAHSENTFFGHHTHPHQKSQSNHGGTDREPHLHEAQDILIDITGTAMGLQLLQAPTQGYLTTPVSLGGGYVKFSHGQLPVPAPATEAILKQHHLPGRMGPVETELCTPTGAALLAALKARLSGHCMGVVVQSGLARGSRDLPVPPLKIMLCREAT